MALGYILMQYDWDWPGAQMEFRRALEVAPGNVDALRGCAYLARDYLGRMDEAIVLARRAVALDPLSSRARFTLGSCYQWAGHLNDAAASYRVTLDITPNAGAAPLRPCAHLPSARQRCGGARGGRTGNPSVLSVAGGGTGAAYARRRDRLERGAGQINRGLRRRRPGRDSSGVRLARRTRLGLPMARERIHCARSSDERDCLDPLHRSLRNDSRWPVLMQKMGFTNATRS